MPKLKLTIRIMRAGHDITSQFITQNKNIKPTSPDEPLDDQDLFGGSRSLVLILTNPLNNHKWAFDPIRNQQYEPPQGKKLKHLAARLEYALRQGDIHNILKIILPHTNYVDTR